MCLRTRRYQIDFDIKNFENRGGLCADKACKGGEGCCQSPSCAITSCNYTLTLCQRLSSKPYSYLRVIDNKACRSSIRKIDVGVREWYGHSSMTISFIGASLVSMNIEIDWYRLLLYSSGIRSKDSHN